MAQCQQRVTPGQDGHTNACGKALRGAQGIMDSLLSTHEVADRLGVDIKTVRRYIHSGKLKATRIGRDYRILSGSLTSLLQSPEEQAVANRSAVITAVDQNARRNPR